MSERAARLVLRRSKIFIRAVIWIVVGLSVSYPILAKDFRSKTRWTYDDVTKVAYVNGLNLSYLTSPNARNYYGLLAKIDFAKKEVTAIPGPWEKGAIFRMELSPDRQWLALLYRGQAGRILFVLLDIDGNDAIVEIHSDESSRVRFYDWSPDSKQLIYVTGKGVGGGRTDVPFESTGAFLYDLASQESEKIADVAYQAIWAEHDNSIYVDVGGKYENKILRLNLNAGEQIKTDYLDLNFSPSGKYYFYRVSEEENLHWKLVRASNGDIVHTFWQSAIQFGMGDYRWQSENLLSLSGVTNNYLYDAASAKFLVEDDSYWSEDKIRYENAYVAVAFGGDNKMVVYREGNWEVLDIVTKQVLASVSNPLFTHRDVCEGVPTKYKCVPINGTED